MTLALGILLLTVGALLVWGVDYELAGVDLAHAGVILIVVGGVGAILALATAARTRQAGTSL
jgi:uncharacterized membrane protein